MKFIKDMKPGDRLADIYFCKYKAAATTKNGKPYENVTLQDRTGTADAKIWEPNGQGIDEFEAMDYVDIFGEVTSFNGALQVNIKRVRRCREAEVDAALYMPVSARNREEMVGELETLIGSIGEPHLKALLEAFFLRDLSFREAFCKSSAAKTVHHAFIGGLLEHTLSVAQLCDFISGRYAALDRDLLVTAAILHDIGKVRELSAFPANDYTDEGQFMGHIVMGSEMISERIRTLEESFPAELELKLKHCILAHHGELEYGSPKKPALIEAMALNHADDLDAKLETFSELLAASGESGWLGFNRLLETNIYKA
ncbi:MAG: HD domain-containing protein [Butyrivibrio sp.]|nr:HD domain-containing protein [Butyrivibrio sp.]